MEILKFDNNPDYNYNFEEVVAIINYEKLREEVGHEVFLTSNSLKYEQLVMYRNSRIMKLKSIISKLSAVDTPEYAQVIIRDILLALDQEELLFMNGILELALYAIFYSVFNNNKFNEYLFTTLFNTREYARLQEKYAHSLFLHLVNGWEAIIDNNNFNNKLYAIPTDRKIGINASLLALMHNITIIPIYFANDDNNPFNRAKYLTMRQHNYNFDILNLRNLYFDVLTYGDNLEEKHMLVATLYSLFCEADYLHKYSVMKCASNSIFSKFYSAIANVANIREVNKLVFEKSLNVGYLHNYKKSIDNYLMMNSYLCTLLSLNTTNDVNYLKKVINDEYNNLMSRLGDKNIIPHDKVYKSITNIFLRNYLKLIYVDPHYHVEDFYTDLYRNVDQLKPKNIQNIKFFPLSMIPAFRGEHTLKYAFSYIDSVMEEVKNNYDSNYYTWLYEYVKKVTEVKSSGYYEYLKNSKNNIQFATYYIIVYQMLAQKYPILTPYVEKYY